MNEKTKYLDTCKYCRISNDYCWDNSSNKWHCTREKGHKGDHIACLSFYAEDTSEHIVDKW